MQHEDSINIILPTEMGEMLLPYAKMVGVGTISEFFRVAVGNTLQEDRSPIPPNSFVVTDNYGEHLKQGAGQKIEEFKVTLGFGGAARGIFNKLRSQDDPDDYSRVVEIMADYMKSLYAAMPPDEKGKIFGQAYPVNKYVL